MSKLLFKQTDSKAEQNKQPKCHMTPFAMMDKQEGRPSSNYLWRVLVWSGSVAGNLWPLFSPCAAVISGWRRRYSRLLKYTRSLQKQRVSWPLTLLPEQEPLHCACAWRPDRAVIALTHTTHWISCKGREGDGRTLTSHQGRPDSTTSLLIAISWVPRPPAWDAVHVSQH